MIILTIFLKIQMRKCLFVFFVRRIERNFDWKQITFRFFHFERKKNNVNLKRLIFYKKKQQFITILSQKKMTTVKNQLNKIEFSFVLNISWSNVTSKKSSKDSDSEKISKNEKRSIITRNSALFLICSDALKNQAWNFLN